MRLAVGLAWPALVLLRLAGADTSYPGGSDERGYCIDICEDAPHEPACFDPEDEACQSKTNSPGKWRLPGPSLVSTTAGCCRSNTSLRYLSH